MEFKHVNVTDSISIPVPKGLTPDEEANYLASRIAFVNFAELEAQCREGLRQLEAGELLPFDQVLSELDREYGVQDGQSE